MLVEERPINNSPDEQLIETENYWTPANTC